MAGTSAASRSPGPRTPTRSSPSSRVQLLCRRPMASDRQQPT
jgi:hypothetical protein